MGLLMLKNSDLNIPRQKKRHKRIVLMASLFILQSCVSTSLDNNLDTTVDGKGNNVVFSWSEQHPFAQTYKTARMQLVAEYVEEDTNGNTRNVKQVLTQQARNFAEINTKVFTLPQKLRSIPRSSNVCLYLSMNNQPVPIRTSTAGSESSRFAFPFWQKNVYSKTKGDFYKQIIARAENNVRQAKDAERRALNAPFSALNNLNALLKKENTGGISTISSPEQCQDIVIKPKPIAKTLDILDEKQIAPTANAICTGASFVLVDYIARLNRDAKTSSAKQKIRQDIERYTHALILPTIYRSQKTLQKSGFFESEQFLSIKPIYEKFANLANFAMQYKQQTNVYQPNNIEIHSSAYTKEAGKFTIYDSLLGLPDRNYSSAQIKEVVINEWTEITYCTYDLVKHLNTKRKSYALNVENAPKRAVASTKYFKNYCASVFENKVDESAKFTNQRIQAEQKLADLKAKFSVSELDASKNPFPTEQQLNQLACKI